MANVEHIDGIRKGIKNFKQRKAEEEPNRESAGGGAVEYICMCLFLYKRKYTSEESKAKETENRQRKKTNKNLIQVRKEPNKERQELRTKY